MQMRPRVIHRLAGRLRVHIPALKIVEDNVQEIADTFLRKFALPEGINITDINYITGNVVIYYDKVVTNERRVLTWLLAIRDLMLSAIIKIDRMDAQKKIKIIEDLKQYLIISSENGVIIDQNFVIPDEIWQQK
jgi:hypothetical protein